MTDGAPVRAAAAVVLVRDGAQVLMGQRGKAAVFMPSKYVFPGGGVDPGDHGADHLDAACLHRLGLHASGPQAQAIAGCALRELREETGLVLRPGAPLRFIFRAITPPGSPRRFDARFFLADAADILGDVDDFAQATDELSHLHWIALAQARSLDLPFITEVVLAEVAALLAGHLHNGVPFFDNSGSVPSFRRLI